MRSRPRIAVAVVVLLAVLGSGQAVAAPRAGSTSLASLESRVLVDLNRIRAAHGLGPLRLNPSLCAAAAQHANEMLKDGYFSHDSADGSAFWQRIALFYPDAHYAYWTVGENLLWTGASLSAGRAMRMWMASPAHRRNILTARWREVGIAAAYEQDAPGMYAGYNVTVVATDFGARH
ncbi:MAG TPA: CAP domain-containing protein [Gaiellaceae bacterium]|nr:CAP domain-containing protein [Gaiellaceae bacterium]